MTKLEHLFKHVLTRYCGIFAIIFLLPVSAAYGVYSSIRNWISFRLNSALAKHDARVEAVIRQIVDWKNQGADPKLCTVRSGWKTMSELAPKHKLFQSKIDVGMYDQLEIDEQRGIIREEPLAAIGQISRSLISRGWALPVALPLLEKFVIEHRGCQTLVCENLHERRGV